MPGNAPDGESAGRQRVLAALDWVGYPGDPEELLLRLGRYKEWLETEAATAGGIGPGETSRLWSRHLADSLTFLAGLDEQSTVVDVGSGAGLPGIPLAMARPEVGFTLLDRSQRRCDLVSRAVRVLGLDNVDVFQGDATRIELPHEAAVSRAVKSPEGFAPVLRKLLPSGSVAVLGGSHRRHTAPRDTAAGGFEIIRVPEAILGEAAWLVKLSLLE